MTSAPVSTPTPERQRAPIVQFREQHRFLSNFYVIAGGISWQGISGQTVEHVFQAAKTTDTAARLAVLSAKTAAEAKSLGRRVPLRADWETSKLGVMAGIQAAKYAAPELARALLNTGDAELIEGNHWCDTFWGVCTCPEHQGLGESWLGRILMIQRSFLVAQGSGA